MKHSNTTLILSSYDKILFNTQTAGSVKYSSQTSTIYLKIQKKETRKDKFITPPPKHISFYVDEDVEGSISFDI